MIGDDLKSSSFSTAPMENDLIIKYMAIIKLDGYKWR